MRFWVTSRSVCTLVSDRSATKADRLVWMLDVILTSPVAGDALQASRGIQVTEM
jgi:hypothetical protein